MEYQCRAEIRLPEVDAFTRGYLEAAEWAGLDDEGHEALELSVSPTWSARALFTAMSECLAFQAANAGALEDYYAGTGLSESSAGLDFYLTRNRHGAGFWDRGAGAAGDSLTREAHAYGANDVWFDPVSEELHLTD
jgi:hypothetical protein